jgi:hypothetical protein
MSSTLSRPIAACALAGLIGAAVAVLAPCGAPAQRPPITIPPATQIAPFATLAVPLGPPAPRTVLPTAIETVRDPRGAGIVMYGRMTAKTDSALGVLSAIFAYSQAFDPTPTPLLTVADQGDRSAQVLFGARVRGVPVLGIAVAALNDDAGEVSVFYDYADAFASSFPRLQHMLAHNGESELGALRLADGNEISLPPGWRVSAEGKALVEVSGPTGELISLGDTIPVYAGPAPPADTSAQGACCDPVAGFQSVFPWLAAAAQRRGLPAAQLTGIAGSAATAAPTGGRGALLLANLSIGGQPYLDLAFVEAIGGFVDPWTLRLSSALAPQPVFAAELPALLAVWSSYSANPAGFGDRLKRAAQDIDALHGMLPPADATLAQYRADEAWEEPIRRVAGDTNRPVNDTEGLQLVERLNKDTGAIWHIVPAH